MLALAVPAVVEVPQLGPLVLRIPLPEVVTERGATRADDKFSEAAMEDRKKEGYF